MSESKYKKAYLEGIDKGKQIAYDEMLYNCLLDNKEIPSNTINGEVVKALFPNIENNFSNVLDLRLWWNSAYKAESEDGR